MILLLAIFEMQNDWLCLLTTRPPLTHASIQPNWINFSAHVSGPLSVLCSPAGRPPLTRKFFPPRDPDPQIQHRVPTALTIISAGEDLKQQARGQACFGFQITSRLWYSFKILSLVLRFYGIFNWINKRDSKESASSQ